MFKLHDDSHAALDSARPPLLVCQLQVFPTIINSQNICADIHIFLQNAILRRRWNK